VQEARLIFVQSRLDLSSRHRPAESVCGVLAGGICRKSPASRAKFVRSNIRYWSWRSPSMVTRLDVHTMSVVHQSACLKRIPNLRLRPADSRSSRWFSGRTAPPAGLFSSLGNHLPLFKRVCGSHHSRGQRSTQPNALSLHPRRRRHRQGPATRLHQMFQHAHRTNCRPPADRFLCRNSYLCRA
jgi:hypothetical protein